MLSQYACSFFLTTTPCFLRHHQDGHNAYSLSLMEGGPRPRSSPVNFDQCRRLVHCAMCSRGVPATQLPSTSCSTAASSTCSTPRTSTRRRNGFTDGHEDEAGKCGGSNVDGGLDSRVSSPSPACEAQKSTTTPALGGASAAHYPTTERVGNSSRAAMAWGRSHFHRQFVDTPDDDTTNLYYYV